MTDFPPPPPPSPPPPAPPPPPGAYYGGAPSGGGAGPKPDNNLVWAILSTIFCCLPLGIASIVFAAQVDGKWAQGDHQGARDAADKAKRFAMIAAGVGVGMIILFIMIPLMLGGSDTDF
ncbi:MAG: CD225/dispanin family protein [Acidimicrobiia bacterium]